jgi:nitrile hydratase accessory protein
MTSPGASGAPARLDIEGPAAPPRRNGTLVFAAPWESRAFALAIALSEGGLWPWNAFRDRLIEAIAGWHRGERGAGAWCYYERWVSALEAMLIERGLLTRSELLAQERAEAARAHHQPPVGAGGARS